jgi:hypothetical protein
MFFFKHLEQLQLKKHPIIQNLLMFHVITFTIKNKVSNITIRFNTLL